MLLLQEIKMVIGDRFYISTEKLFLNDFYEILKVINLGLFCYVRIYILKYKIIIIRKLCNYCNIFFW